jgi:hypothetical protein
MASKKDDRSSQEQRKRDSWNRRDAEVKGSTELPADQSQSGPPASREQMRGSETQRPQRQPGRLPLPD